jgi:hypothetical protein
MKNFLSLFLITLTSLSTFARPEYAVREKVNCIRCHVNPYGAGHRRVYGKFHGAKGMPEAKTSESDMLYADFRAVEYVRTAFSNREVRGGFGLMTAEISANIQVFERDELAGREYNTYLVVGNDFGSFNGGTRNAYVLSSKVEEADLVNSFLIGRFISPFGLMTDEHRTYTKMATSSRYNQDFQMGMMLSGNFTETFHYDFALINGFTSGKFTDADQETVGTIVNSRWFSMDYPILLGASFKYIDVKQKKDPPSDAMKSPYAAAVYAVFDFGSVTSNKFPLSIQGEFTQAKYYNVAAINTSIGKYFANSPTYRTAIQDSMSHAYVILAKYDFNNQWQMLAKYDHLLLDKNHRLDAHKLYGLGLRYQFNANMNVQIRAERADVSRQDLIGSHSSYDDLFILYRMWL